MNDKWIQRWQVLSIRVQEWYELANSVTSNVLNKKTADILKWVSGQRHCFLIVLASILVIYLVL